MATKHKTIAVSVCDLCSKEADVSVCAHCRKEVCVECGWRIKCGSFGFLVSVSGIACEPCRDYLKRLLNAFGFAEHIGR
jgi:hypothetical protein